MKYFVVLQSTDKTIQSTLSNYAFQKYFHAKRKKKKSGHNVRKCQSEGHCVDTEHAAKVEWPKTPGLRGQQKSKFRDSYYCHSNPWFSKTTATPKN